MVKRAMALVLSYTLTAYGTAGQDALKTAEKQNRIFGTVHCDGKAANGFLIAVEKKELELSRMEDEKTPMRIGRTEKPVKWPIKKNALIPEYIVIKKGQQLVITENESTSRQLFLYNSIRQRMPGVFNPFDAKPEFSFGREEIGIVFYSVTRPHILSYVSVLDHTNYCFTDINGKFGIQGEIPKGKYDLWINHPRYGSWFRQVDFPGNKAIEIRVLSNEKVDKNQSNFWGLTASPPFFGGK